MSKGKRTRFTPYRAEYDGVENYVCGPGGVAIFAWGASWTRTDAKKMAALLNSAYEEGVEHGRYLAEEGGGK